MKRLLFFFLFGSQIVSAQNKDVITPEANLILQGIPEIPASIKRGIQQYTESRSAVFLRIGTL